MPSERLTSLATAPGIRVECPFPTSTMIPNTYHPGTYTVSYVTLGDRPEIDLLHVSVMSRRAGPGHDRVCESMVPGIAGMHSGQSLQDDQSDGLPADRPTGRRIDPPRPPSLILFPWAGR